MNITSRLRAARTLLVALVALTVLAGCAVHGGNSTSESSSSGSPDNGDSGDGATESATYTIEQSVRMIVLDARAGGVSVMAQDGPVSITERATYTGGKPVTSHQVDGDTLNLREEGCPGPGDDDRCQVVWEIKAPAGTVLDLQMRSGGIELRSMAGGVTARASSGGVEGYELTSRRVTATSDAGGIELDFTEPPDEVKAESRAGGVTITVPPGTSYAVRAGTRAGEAEIEVPQDQASTHKISATARAGGVEIKAR